MHAVVRQFSLTGTNVFINNFSTRHFQLRALYKLITDDVLGPR